MRIIEFSRHTFVGAMSHFGPLAKAGMLCLSMVLRVEAADGAPDVFALRQEYNAVSARIDSLVRAMQALDAKALDAKALPAGEAQGPVPEGMAVVLIFWADDEARVWVNDYLVGETRLAPVEVTIPSIYLGGHNHIRARCWDTDWVESGFLCGLYLRDQGGNLHPILVSDRSWQTEDGPAQEITYVHPMPDIPGAKVVWAPRIFGSVELVQTFDRQAIQQAASAPAVGLSPGGQVRRMDYHVFVQRLAHLQARRKKLKQMLQAPGKVGLPGYEGQARRLLSLTLGKAGPLQEDAALLAERVQAWARALPEAQKRLIYPKQRELKGEVTPAFAQAPPTGGKSGERQLAYRPPEERERALSGERQRSGEAGRQGSGETDQGVGGGGWGGGGRASRLGLWVPTLVLALYMGYVISRWQDLTEGKTRFPWGD